MLMPASRCRIPLGGQVNRAADPVVEEDFDLDDVPAVEWSNLAAAQLDSAPEEVQSR